MTTIINEILFKVSVTSALALVATRLARRVSALLDARQQRGRAGALQVGLTCAAAALLVAAISPLHIVAGSAAQTRSTAGPKFEVASVKPCNAEELYQPGMRRQETTITPGRIAINCVPLARIAYFAYAGVGSMNHPLLNDAPGNPDHIRGGPGWVRSDTFVIEAKAEGTPTREVMMGPMLRALLEERFQLKTHRETEEVPMYTLTVAKGGLKIKPLDPGGCTSTTGLSSLSREDLMAAVTGPKPPCGNFTSLGGEGTRKWILGGETLARFANQTLSSVMDRFVMDKTGVDGMFNIRLEFDLYDDNVRQGVFGGRFAGAKPEGLDPAVSIFTALEEQLGLKLEKSRGPREYLVIDTAEKPSGL